VVRGPWFVKVKMKQVKAKIVENKHIAPDFYKMRVESHYLAKAAKPGQFIEVKCSDELDPLLRRPFGVHRIFSNGIEMLYEVVGKGTKILSQKKPGEMVDILGPLGNGFDLVSNSNVILVAGGIGVAPLPAVAEALIKTKSRAHVIIGAKKKSHILCGSEFKSLGCSVSIVTEDGSMGKKGLVTDILTDVISRTTNHGPRATNHGPRTTDHGPQTTIYACGPNDMLRAIWNIAQAKNIPCQFSFESHMACGMGVCLGCPIKVRKGLIDFEYKMICKDGPVFKGEEIMW
jgi:dihydroorotate dehydrogenase electron transfer subunit